MVEGQAIDQFTSQFISPRPGEKKPKAEKPAKKPEKKAEPKIEPKPAPKPTPAPHAPQLSADDIAEAAARGVATAMKAEKPVETPKPDDKSTLPASEQRRITVLKQLETANPDKYKGLAERYEKSLTNLVDYAEKWEAAHPGETFDEDADEHKEFVAKNEEGLDWEDDDYTEALADMKLSEKMGVRDRKEAEQNKRARTIQEAIPKINEARLNRSREFLKKVGDEYAGLVGEDGKANPAVFEKLNAEDPVKTEIIVSSADLVEKLVAANYALFNRLENFDGQNPLHRSISGFMLQKEAELLAKPAAEQLDAQGRKFMAAADYHNPKTADATRAKHWTFGQKDVEALLVHGIYNQAKAQIANEDQKFEKRVKARGYAPPQGGSPAPAAPIVKPAPKAEDDDDENGKPNTPEVAPQPARLPGGNPPPADAPSQFTSRFLGKKV